jgi:hypothetical protein
VSSARSSRTDAGTSIDERPSRNWANRENEECNRHFRAGAARWRETTFPRSERRVRTGIGSAAGHATISAALATMEANLSGATEKRHWSADVRTIKPRDRASRDGSKRDFVELME